MRPVSRFFTGMHEDQMILQSGAFGHRDIVEISDFMRHLGWFCRSGLHFLKNAVCLLHQDLHCCSIPMSCYFLLAACCTMPRGDVLVPQRKRQERKRLCDALVSFCRQNFSAFCTTTLIVVVIYRFFQRLRRVSRCF